MAHDDNFNLKLLYELADGKPYNETKRSTCVDTFVISYPKIEKEFKLDGPLKQIGGADWSWTSSAQGRRIYSPLGLPIFLRLHKL